MFINSSRVAAAGCLTLCLAAAASAATAQPASVAGVNPLQDDRPRPPQPAQATTNGDIVVVGASPEADELVARTSSVASKSDEPLVTTPSSVSVVTRAQLDQQNARTMAEALRYTAGASGDAGSGYTTRFDQVEIRGFQGAAGADEFVDGLRLFNGAYYATQQVDPYLLDRIDLLKGPSSVLYGQANPGGVIVLGTKRPVSTPVHEVSVEGGTYGYVRGSLDLGGPIDGSGHWLYRLAATATTSGTQDRFTRNERIGVLPSISWIPTSNLDVTLSGLWQRDPRGGDYDSAPLAGTVLPNPNGPISRYFYGGDPAFETYRRTQKSVWSEINYRFLEGWQFSSYTRYARVHALYQQVSSGGQLDDDLRTIERQAFSSFERFKTASNEEHVTGSVTTGAITHKILIGGNWQMIDDHGNQYYADAPPLDVYAPVRGIPYPDLALIADQHLTTNQEGAFAEDRIQVERLHVSLGVRHDWSTIRIVDLTGGPIVRQSYQHTTFRTGVLYETKAGISPYFNYSQSFQPTTMLSFSGDPFLPTRGSQYEAGVKYQPHAVPLLMTIAAYDLLERDALYPDPEHVGLNLQTNGIRSRGVEFEAHASPVKGLNLIGAYAYQHVAFTKDDGDLAGRRPAGVPRWTASGWAHYDFADNVLAGFGAGIGVRHGGRSTVDNRLAILAPGYTLIDVQLQYKPNDFLGLAHGFLFQVTIQNALNARYFPGCTSSDIGCYIGSGRNVIGKVTFDF